MFPRATVKETKKAIGILHPSVTATFLNKSIKSTPIMKSAAAKRTSTEKTICGRFSITNTDALNCLLVRRRIRQLRLPEHRMRERFPVRRIPASGTIPTTLSFTAAATAGIVISRFYRRAIFTPAAALQTAVSGTHATNGWPMYGRAKRWKPTATTENSTSAQNVSCFRIAAAALPLRAEAAAGIFMPPIRNAGKTLPVSRGSL